MLVNWEERIKFIICKAIKIKISNKFKINLLSSYFSDGIAISLGFLQLFLINKYFGLEAYGQLTIIISTAGIFSNLLTARSSEAVTKFYKREKLNERKENAKSVLLFGFSIDFITSLFLFTLVYFLSDYLVSFFLKNNSLDDEMILFSIVSVLSFLRGSLIGYLQANELFVKINLGTIIESSSKILFLVLFVFYFQQTLLIYLVLCFLFASLISYLYTLFVFFKEYIKEMESIKFYFNRALFKEYWGFNIRTFFSSSLKAGNNNIDNLIVGHFLNVQSVGVYQTIKKLLSPIMMVSSPFSRLIYPKLIHLFETKEKLKFKRIIIKSSGFILLVSTFYLLAIYIFLEDVFFLMDIPFTNAYILYFFLIAILTFLMSQMWWARIFSNTIDPSYSLYMNVFAVVFQLTATIIATKWFNLSGLLCSMITMNLLIFIYWIKKGSDYVSIFSHDK